MPDLIFRNGILPEICDNAPHSVLVRDGIIQEIDPRDDSAQWTGIDCRGMLLLPGAIDMHVHFREPGATHKEDLASGAAAAASGGVTTVADMPNNTPAIVTAEAFLAKAALANRISSCDVKLYMGLAAGNLNEISEVCGHPGFAGVKVFLGATTGSLLCDLDTLRLAAARLDCLFVFHAESNTVLQRASAAFGPGQSASDHLSLRPVEAALSAVSDIASVYRPGMRFHICHVSTAAELEIIRATPGMTCEAAPHHLAFDASLADRLGDLAKMNPPLRAESDRAGLMSALRAGRIDCLATDHAPHTLEEKSRPWPQAPAGVPGVETLVPWTLGQVQAGSIPLSLAIALLSTNPARILGLSDRGSIRPGLRADIMVWDPRSRWTVAREDIRSKCGWSLFEGMELAGRPRHVCSNGKMLY